ncbi:MAG: hypothetical protein GXP34_03055 [Actinobacteria bacterium]|nr:hypothetical protein [Actinomycetota bacterium]
MPLLWIAGTAVGVGLGVLAQVTVAWPWFPVAVGWLVVMWLAVLTTALRTSGRERLWTELVQTVSPTRAEQLETKRLVKAVEAAPGPPYGLAQWDGLRSPGGHGWASPVGLQRIELIYGEPPDGPYLRVDTQWKLPGLPAVELVKADVTRGLWHDSFGPPPESLSPDEAARWAARRYEEFERRPIPVWDHFQLSIDDTMRDGQMLVDGNNWAAVVDLPDTVVTLRACGLPAGDIALTPVEDLTPFIEGTTELRNRSRRRHHPDASPDPQQDRPPQEG